MGWVVDANGVQTPTRGPSKQAVQGLGRGRAAQHTAQHTHSAVAPPSCSCPSINRHATVQQHEPSMCLPLASRLSSSLSHLSFPSLLPARLQSSRFTQYGVRHYEMYFPDGTCPSEQTLLRFLDTAEREPGALAVSGWTGRAVLRVAREGLRFLAPGCPPTCLVPASPQMW